MEMGFGFSQPNDQKIMFLLACLLPLKFACVRHWALSTIRINKNGGDMADLEELSSTERTNPHGFSVYSQICTSAFHGSTPCIMAFLGCARDVPIMQNVFWPNVFRSNSSSNLNSSSWLCVSFAVNIIIIGSMIRNGNQQSNENIVIWIEIHPDFHQQRHTGAL